MGTPNKYNEGMCATALKVLADGESKVAVAAELDISRTTLYEWMDTHPEFKDAIERGLTKSQRLLEKHGRDGMLGELEKFNASSWIFMMKNRFRDDYGDVKEDKSSESFVEKFFSKLAE
jgi:hypothetical protein